MLGNPHIHRSSTKQLLTLFFMSLEICFGDFVDLFHSSAHMNLPVSPYVYDGRCSGRE